MKKSIYLLVIIIMSVAYLSSCKKDDTQPESSNCKKEQTIIYANGEQTGTKLYGYNDRSLLEKELFYDVQGDLTDSFYHSYDDKGRLISSYYFNYPYNLEQFQTWKYNSMDKEEYYELTVNGSTSGIKRSYYNSGGVLDSVHYTSNNGLKRLIYIYDKETLVEIKTYDEFYIVEGRSLYSYSGLSTTIKNLDASGELLNTVFIQTNSKGQEVDWKQTEANGTVSIHRVTVYDEKGNVIKVTDIYDGSGTYEYITTWICE